MVRAGVLVRLVTHRAADEYVAAFEAGDAILQEYAITTPDRLAHFLAQVLHESGGLYYKRENMNYREDRLLAIFGVGKHSAAVTPAEAKTIPRRSRSGSTGSAIHARRQNSAMSAPATGSAIAAAASCRPPAAPTTSGWAN